MEVKEYILKKIIAAGSSEKIIDNSSINTIIKYSNGLPSNIDKIMNAALILADFLNTNIVSDYIVNRVINDVIFK